MRVAAERHRSAEVMAAHRPPPPPSVDGDPSHYLRQLDQHSQHSRYHDQQLLRGVGALPPERTITPELGSSLSLTGGGGHASHDDLSPRRRQIHQHFHQEQQQQANRPGPAPLSQPYLDHHRPGPAPPSEWPSPRQQQQQQPESAGGAPPAVSPALASTSAVAGAGAQHGSLGPRPTASFSPLPPSSAPPSSSAPSSSAPPAAATPPLGPTPLRLSRHEIDELYDVLNAVLSTLDALGVPHVLIGSSLLGSVRSKSLLFHEETVEVAIIDDEDVASDGTAEFGGESGGGGTAAGRVCRYERVVRDMPALLRRAARARTATAAAESSSSAAAAAVEYTYVVRPDGRRDGSAAATCDRAVSSLAPRVGVDVYVLRRYRNPGDLLRLISVGADGRTARPLADIERIMAEIETSAAAAALSSSDSPMRMRGEGVFPLYHFDSRAAIEERPRHYFLPQELLPLRREYDFGPLTGCVPGPRLPVRALRRFHGDDCFTHYSSEDGAQQQESQRIPLADEQYVPVQHSRPERRVSHVHGRVELERYLSSEAGWYTASVDADAGAGHEGLQIPDMEEDGAAAPSTGRGLTTRQQPRLQRALPSLHSRSIFGSARLAQPRQQQMQPPLASTNSPQQRSLLSSSSSSSLLSMQQQEQEQDQQSSSSIAAVVRRHTASSPDAPNFDQRLRELMEPYIAPARAERERARENALAAATTMHTSATTAGGDRTPPQSALQRAATRHATLRVPYPKLRSERPFLFDPATYPLHRALSDAIGIDDLSKLHEHPLSDRGKAVLFDALLHRATRRTFHECYDNFVTGFCIPLLHSLAMTQGIFESNAAATSGMSHHGRHRRAASTGGGLPHESGRSRSSNPNGILYRYQAFPTLRVVRPGEASTDPHCDVARGHSVGNINFHIPLTPSFGTNALYAESHPGREDWHPLGSESLGLGYVYDGARCLHFGLENTTDRTRVSLSFRVAVARCSSSSGSAHRNAAAPGGGYRRAESSSVDTMDTDPDDVDAAGVDDTTDELCSDRILRDAYSAAGSGYYAEAVIDTGAGGTSNGAGGGFGGFSPGVVVRKCGDGSGSGNAQPGRLLDPDGRVGFPFA